MNFGFIQVAAPASQPVPPADAAVPADVSKDAAAAFDAALAATLGPVDGQAAPVAGTGGKVPQPAWLLAQFLAPSATAFDLATTEVTTPEESAPADELAVPADGTGDEERSDEVGALAAGVVIPMPVIAEVKNPVVPQGHPVAQGGIDPNGEQAQPAPMPQVRVPAGIDGTAETHVPADVVPGNAVVPANAPVHPAKVPVVADAVAAEAPDVAPARSSVDSMSAPVGQPVSADALSGIAADRREMPVPAKAQMPRPAFAHAGAQSSDAVQHAAAAAPAVANALGAVAEQAAPAANATSISPRPEPAESGAAARHAISWQAPSRQDAPMTGQDHSGQGQSQGQGRPWPGFTRFAAALAQVTSAGAEDGGRATAPVVAPAATATSPAAAPAPVTAAAATAAPQPAPETPEAESLGRLVQTMRVMSRPGAWEANVRLKPEHLGDVSIAVRVERNTVSAVVNAEAAGVRQWLESQEQAVRSGMAEHGLHLERFVVQRDGQRREPQQQQESPRHRTRRPALPADRFEIVV